MNFDPRSAHTNTEIGIAVRSPELCARIVSAYRVDTGVGVYEVLLEPDGRSIAWVGKDEDGNLERLDAAPETTWFQRLRLFLVSLLIPEDWL